MTDSLLTAPAGPAGQGRGDDASGRHCVVIGAGFGGMAAALRLAAMGYRVTLCERGDSPGGRGRGFERDGFRFDAGPTVITAPQMFDDLFALHGRKRSDYVAFEPLDPWYRFWFQDGETFDYGATLEQTLAEIRRFDERDADGYMRMLEHSRKLFEAGFLELASQPFHQLWTMAREAPRLVRLGAHRTVWGFVSRYLRHPKLRQAFSIQPLLLGGSPFDTTSIYGLIHFLEHKWGVHCAVGGVGAIASALDKLMGEVGIEVRYGATVRRLQIDGRRVTGVEIEGSGALAADIVVSNADPLHLYDKMVGREHRAVSVRLKQRLARLSMGLFVLYFGTTRQYPALARHTIWFGPRYREHLDDIFKRKILADDFSLYIHRPTANDPSFAPPGADSFYVLCPVPNLDAGIDWSREAPLLRNRIVSELSRTVMPELEHTITAEFAMTPEDFAGDYLSASGAGFSLAPHFTQSAWFRFHNRAEGLDGLYLTGAGTHPGAGLPGVLSSAELVAKMVAERAKPVAERAR